MGKIIHKKILKILKINSIDKKQLKISVLFSNGEDRVFNFNKIFKTNWKVFLFIFQKSLKTPKASIM